MLHRVALIPGGARGIGRAVALALAADGWAIAICYRTSAAEAGAVIDEAKAMGAHGAAYPADVSDPSACSETVQAIVNKWGHIDALINCAGPYRRVPLLSETVEGWHTMFNNNLHSVFYLVQEVAPIMRERRHGRIINFSIVNAAQAVGQTEFTAHYIAKVGVLVLTRSFARALAPYGITVNAISPGFIDTQSADADPEGTGRIRIPAGRLGQDADAVGAVRYLLSRDAEYVNGANLQISGAWGV